ncbi:MAG: hypothetical protein WCB04_03535 [Mycobacteriales bacterium]
MPLTRRKLLMLFGGILVGVPAGCTLGGGDAKPSTNASPAAPDPLIGLLGAEHAMLALYDSVLARYPQLARQLGPVRADHAAHVEALRAAAGLASPNPSAQPSITPRPVVAPPSAAAGIAKLRAAETAAAGRLSRACLIAPVDRAPLLGSIAACESAHLVLVR